MMLHAILVCLTLLFPAFLEREEVCYRAVKQSKTALYMDLNNWRPCEEDRFTRRPWLGLVGPTHIIETRSSKRSMGDNPSKSDQGLLRSTDDLGLKLVKGRHPVQMSTGSLPFKLTKGENPSKSDQGLLRSTDDLGFQMVKGSHPVKMSAGSQPLKTTMGFNPLKIYQIPAIYKSSSHIQWTSDVTHYKQVDFKSSTHRIQIPAFSRTIRIYRKNRIRSLVKRYCRMSHPTKFIYQNKLCYSNHYKVRPVTTTRLMIDFGQSKSARYNKPFAINSIVNNNEQIIKYACVQTTKYKIDIKKPSYLLFGPHACSTAWYSSHDFRQTLNLLMNAENEIWKHAPIINFISQNVRTLKRGGDDDTYNSKLRALSKFGTKFTATDTEHNPDYCHIIFLQETNLINRTNTNDLKMQFPYHKCMVSGVEQINIGDKRQGLITLIDLQWNISHYEQLEGRVAFFTFDLPTQKGTNVSKLAFINIYGPTGFLETTSKQINERLSVFIQKAINRCRVHGHELTIIGDWNGVVDPTLDRVDKFSRNIETTTLEIALQNNLDDAYRYLNPDGQDLSYKDISRIDIIMTSKKMTESLKKVQYKQLDYDFDHKSVQWTIIEKPNNFYFPRFNAQNLANEPISFIKKLATTEKDWVNFKDYNIEHFEDELREFNDKAFEIIMEDSPYNAMLWIDSATKLFHDTLTAAALETLPHKTIDTTIIHKNKNKSCKRIKRIQILSKLVKDIQKQRRDLNEADCILVNKEIDSLHEFFKAFEHELEHITTQNVKSWRNKIKNIVEDIKHQLANNKSSAYIKMEIDEAIDNRLNEWSTGKFKNCINNILNATNEKVVINKIVERTNGIVTNVIDDPEIVLNRTKLSMEAWQGRRNTRLNEMTPEFQEEFRPKNYINPDIYDNLMHPATMKELKLIISETSDKAPGLSKVSANMVKNSSPQHLQLLINIATICFKYSIFPELWTKGVIYPVPKGQTTWDASITNTRPITLLEVPRKMVLKILTTRLSHIILENNVLRGTNPSVLPGTSTDEIIYLVNCAMEDARANNKELWIILQDMRRAFDSVDNEALTMCMRRIRLPEKYIQLFNQINEQRLNCVITAFGNTEFYHPLSGLDQGGVESPLHWRIFYDVLLCYIQTHHEGYQLEHTSINPISRERVTTRINVPVLAYVDDTSLMAKGYTESRAINQSSGQFYYYMGVELNPTKSKALVINEREETRLIPYLFGEPAQEITRSNPDQGERLLGIYISSDGKHKTQKEIIENDIKFFIDTVGRKAITDQIACYLTRMVLFSAIGYRCKLLPLTETECISYDKRLAKMIRLKCGHARTLLKDILHQPVYYAIPKLWDLISENAITSYAVRLNGINQTSLACNILEAQLSERQSLSQNCHNYGLQTLGKSNELIPKLLNIMHQKELIFKTVDHYEQLTQIVHILPPETYKTAYKSLVRHKLIYLDQFLDQTGTITLTWGEITRNNRNRPPKWFKPLIATIAIIDHKSRSENFEVKHAWKPLWIHNPFNDINIEIELPEVQQRRSARLQNLNPKNQLQNYGYLPESTNNFIDNNNKRRRIGSLCLEARIIQEYDVGTTLLPQRQHTIRENIKVTNHHNFILLDDYSTLFIYTDGSLTGLGTKHVSAGCGIIIQDHQMDEFDDTIEHIPRIESYGQLQGQMSSFKTELMGVYYALKLIECCPKRKVKIILDNKSVVDTFDSQMLLSNKRMLKILSEDLFPVWDAIRKLVKAREQSVHLQWVRGHKENLGNLRADKLASRHGKDRSDAQTNKFQTPSCTSQMHTIKAIPFIKKTLIESGVRKTIKHSTVVATSLQYTKTKLFKSIGVKEPFSSSKIGLVNDWQQSSELIHSKVIITSSFTTLEISATRTFMIKAIHGILPTAQILNRRMPLTYDSPYCKGCTQAIETNEHMWECPSTTEERKSIIKKAKKIITKKLDELDTKFTAVDKQIISRVLRCITAFNMKASGKETTKKALEKLVTAISPPNCIQLHDTNRRLVRRIYRQARQVKFSQLCSGVAPRVIKDIVKLLCQYALKHIGRHVMSTERLAISTANKLTSKMYKLITTKAREIIWKPRCTKFIEWEKSKGITNGVKRNLAMRRAHEDATNAPPDILDEEQIIERPHAERQQRKRKHELRQEEQGIANKHYIDLKNGRTEHAGFATYKRMKFK